MNYRNPKIRKSAHGEDCTMNYPGCNNDRETVVLCHLNELFAGKGTGIKAHDFAAFYACSHCHQCYDSVPPQNTDWYVLRAVIRTLKRLFEKGVIK